MTSEEDPNIPQQFRASLQSWAEVIDSHAKALDSQNEYIVFLERRVAGLEKANPRARMRNTLALLLAIVASILVVNALGNQTSQANESIIKLAKYSTGQEGPAVLSGVPGVDENKSTPAPSLTAAEIENVVDNYCRRMNCGKTLLPGAPIRPTLAQITAALADYCKGDRCRGPEGTTGAPGAPGAPGEPGRSIDPNDIELAVAAYCKDGRCRGKDGKSVTQEEIAAEVRKICQGTDACKGPQGAPGKPATQEQVDAAVAARLPQAVAEYCAANPCSSPQPEPDAPAPQPPADSDTALPTP